MDSETQKTETLYEVLAWVETNKKRLAIGGGAVVLVIGIIVTVTWFNKQQEFRASEALSAIHLPLNPSEPVPGDAVDKLQKLTSEYSGTAAALRAELIRAGVLYSSGKYTEAEAAFGKFLRDHPDSRWVSEAYYGVAACLDAQNKGTEAIAKYEDFARRFSTDPNIDEARYHLATLLESLNRPADAVKEYEKIAKATSYSPVQGQAQEHLRDLLTKYPNLAPTNAAPAFPPMAPTLPGTGAVSVVRTNLVPSTNAPQAPKVNVAVPKPAAAPAQPK